MEDAARVRPTLCTCADASRLGGGKCNDRGCGHLVRSRTGKVSRLVRPNQFRVGNGPGDKRAEPLGGLGNTNPRTGIYQVERYSGPIPPVIQTVQPRETEGHSRTNCAEVLADYAANTSGT